MTRRLILALLPGAFFCISSGNLSAQESNPFIETFRQGAVTMSRETFAIVNAIHSVEDADNAEPQLTKVTDEFVLMLNGLSDYIDQGYEGTIEQLGLLESDPELQEWNEKINTAVTKLQQDHPEAAARFVEISNRSSEKLMTATNTLMQKLMARQMPAVNTLEGSDPTKE